MSWQSYVDDNLVSTGRVAKASIFGLDGSLWASSADFKNNEFEEFASDASPAHKKDLTDSNTHCHQSEPLTLADIGGEEAKKLIAAFEDPSGVHANGLYLEGHKYVYLRPADGVCEGFYARKGATGVTCVKTKQAVLVGYYSESMQAGDCNTVVQNLGEYLASTGY